MDRISNLGQHQQLVSAMLRNQRELAEAQLQVSTGKRGDSYDDLGGDAVRQINLSHLLSRETAYAENAGRAEAELAAQDLHVGQAYDAALALKDTILNAIAAGEARGLASAAATAFDALRAAMNASVAGKPLFSGGVTGVEAFAPDSLAALVALPAVADAFGAGGVPRKIIVGDGRSVEVGMDAAMIGVPFADALRTLGRLLPLDGPLDAAASAALVALLPELDAAAATLRDAQAETGARAALTADISREAVARTTALQTALSAVEDVDPAAAITRLQAEQTALQASYQAFARLADMTLLNFL